MKKEFALALKQVDADSLLLAQLENDDAVLVLNQQMIMSREEGQGDPPCLPTAQRLSQALQIPLVFVSLAVPSQEDWTFDDVIRGVLDQLSVPHKPRLFLFQEEETLNRFLCVADGFEQAYAAFQKNVMGANTEQIPARFALCADATMDSFLASIWIRDDYARSAHDRSDLTLGADLLTHFCADLFEDEDAMMAYLLDSENDGDDRGLKDGLYR